MATSLESLVVYTTKMKSVLTFLGIVGSISLYLSMGGARGQYFEDPSKTYQNITFDMYNRGSYNSSDCLYDMLNCWEAVRPDMICLYWKYYASVCTIVRDYCAEGNGDQENYSQIWNMVEGMCIPNRWHHYTK